MNLHICLKTSILGDSITEKGFLHVINENCLPDCHSISGKIMNLHTWEKMLILVQILRNKTSPHVLNRKLQALQIANNLLPLFIINKLKAL